MFETGIIPTSFVVINYEIYIYNNKGKNLGQKYWRPILMVGFFGKLFTPILNNRLCEFIDDYNIINKNQAGFRKRYSTRKYLFMYTF